MNPKVETKLKQCSTVREMFDVLNDSYHLEDCKPGVITKTYFIKGLKSAVNMLKPREK